MPRFTLSETYALVPRRQKIIFGVILLIQFLLSVIFIKQQSFTVDELPYYDYSVRWAKGHADRIIPSDDSKSPIVFPALVPRAAMLLFNPSFHSKDFGITDATMGRYCMWVFVLLTSYVFLCWAYRLYGNYGWLIPLVLLLIDPLFFSYGMLLLSDLPVAAVLFTTAYLYWRYSETHRLRYGMLAGIFFGLTLVAKLSMLFLLPLVLLWFLFKIIFVKRYLVTDTRRKLLHAGLISLLVLFMINAAYFFKGTGHPLSAVTFKSELFSQLQPNSRLRAIPVPLPVSYIQSIDWSLYNALIGGGYENSTYPGVYINGLYKQHGVTWYYYLACLLYKMPLFILLLTVVATGLFFFRKQRTSTKNIFYLLPTFYFLIVLSFFNEFQTGIRHLLIIFPFWYLALAGFIQKAVQSKWRNYFYGLCLLHSILVFRYFPHWIAYTNELLYDKKMYYQHIVDSGIDFGQSEKDLQYFLSVHTDYSMAAMTPSAGKFIIRGYDLVGLWRSNGDHYAWLRNNFKPAGVYKQVFLLYDIKPGDLKKIK